MAIREYLADFFCGDCGVLTRLVPFHPVKEVNEKYGGPVPDCENCGGQGCMACVLREVHDECRDNCPFCCTDDYLPCALCGETMELRQRVEQRESANESDKAAETIPIVGEEGA